MLEPFAVCRIRPAIVLAALLLGTSAGATAIADAGSFEGVPDPIFPDDFESGECSQWSASTNPPGAPDGDEDGYGDENGPITYCVLPDGHVANITDCNDNDPNIYPGAPEICNSFDDDCDGEVDEDFELNSNPSCVLGQIDLGSVAGDQDDQLMESGYGEGWYLLEVKEQVLAGGIDLTARIQLQVPPGVDYDLYVECAPCGGPVPLSSNSGPGQAETIEIGRSDEAGIDRSYDVLIEVRFVSSPACALWQLVVTGHVITSNRACD